MENIKIMLIDDSKTLRKVLIKSLNAIGKFDIYEAENGRQALEILAEEPEMNIAFLDMNMPIMDGWSFIEQVEKTGFLEFLKVIVLSSELAKMAKEEIMQYGVVDAIAKPFTTEKLKEILVPIIQTIDKDFKFCDELEEQLKFEKLPKALLFSQTKSLPKSSNIKDFFNEIEAVSNIDKLKSSNSNIVFINFHELNDFSEIDAIKKDKELFVSVYNAPDDKNLILDLINSSNIDGVLLENADFKTTQKLISKIDRELKKEEIAPKKIEEAIDINAIPDVDLNEDEEKAIVDEILQVEEEFDRKEVINAIDSAINSYFANFSKLIHEYVDYKNKNQQFEYTKFKRFLFSAYNTMSEIDEGIKDEALVRLRKDVEKVGIEFVKLVDISKKMDVAYQYETIFVDKYPMFSRLKKSIESNKAEFDLLNGISKSMDNMIESLTPESEKLNKNSKEFKEMETKIKGARKKMVDALHKSSKLKELNIKLTERFNYLKEQFIEDFKKSYTISVKTKTEDLNKIVNGMTYVMDKQLWQKARVSKQINAFASRSNIKGILSAKTYLEYFLKTVDKSKAGAETQELFQLHDFLSKKNLKNILIYSPNKDVVLQRKSALENADSSYKIYGALTKARALQMATTMSVNFIIFDYEIDKNDNGLNFVKEFQAQKKEIEPEYCMIVKTQSKQVNSSANKLGIYNIINEPKTISEFTQNILQIL